MIGKSISHYRIESELGRGGMGIVYKAHDTKLDRSVALKLLPTSMLSSDEERARFYREARAAAALSHPNIATVYAIDEAVPEGARHDDFRPFIAMEYIDGLSLSDRIKQGPVDLGEAVKIGIQLAAALGTAHEKGIVHRDIKSSNVMLTTKGEPKILDFGLAKTLQSTKLTMTGATMGTAAYMSPEQSRGEPVDARTDLWSLGVILYEMVSGLLPFAGSYEQALVYAILNESPKPLTAIRTGVPMELEWLVGKLLEKDKELRYQSAADALADLKRLEIVLEGGSGISRTRMAPPAGGLFSRRNRRRKSTVTPWVIAFAALGLGAAAGWFVPGATSDELTSPEPIYLDLALPDSLVYFDPNWSADGTRILFSADQGRRSGVIVEYDLRTGTLRELTDADNNLSAQYAPDGRSIFFKTARGRLMRQIIGSSEASSIVRIPRNTDFGWLSPTALVYATADQAVLVRDLETGRDDTLNPELSGNWLASPTVSADSSVLFVGNYGGTQALDLASGQLLPSLAMPYYLLGVTRNGFVLYDRGSVWARKYDPVTKAYAGQGLNVLTSGSGAVSSHGHLIYRLRRDTDTPSYYEPIYVYTNGERREFVAHAGTYGAGDQEQFVMSPDGRYLAVRIIHGGILRFEMSSRTTIQLVDDSTEARPYQYSHDGRWLYYYQRSENRWKSFRVDASEGGVPEELELGDMSTPYPSVARDGRTLAFSRMSEKTGYDVWVKDLVTGQESGVGVLEGGQTFPSISPDGRFVAFESSNRRDEPSVLVKDRIEDRTIAVAEGVTKPRWDWEGKYLYYESTILGAVYRVAFDARDGMHFGEPETMYSDPRSLHTHWDISPQKDTILLSAPSSSYNAGSDWKVVLNWTETLER